MSRRTPRTVWVARCWVALYTRTAPSDAGADRRAEVASDLHEQVASAMAQGWPGRRIGWDIAGRLVRGMPADVAWRVGVEQAPGRLRWHLQHPSTVYVLALWVLVPLGLFADETRGGVDRWSAAGGLGVATLVGCAAVVGFGLVSITYLRPSMAGLRRVEARRVRPFLVGAMSFLWALAGVWRFVLTPLSGVSAWAWALFGAALIAYLLVTVLRAVLWMVRVDLRKIPS